MGTFPISHGLGVQAEDGAEAALVADSRWLKAFAARIVRDPELADDACQEAWLGALEGGQGAGRREDLARRAWRFLFRHWRGERRRRAREREVGALGLSPSVDELLAYNEQQQRLWNELALLDEPYRSTLLLRFQGELSTREIGARMGVPSDTVRWRIREGVSLMRRRLAADERSGGLGALAIFAAHSGSRRTAEVAPVLGTALPIASLGALMMTKKMATCALLLFVLAGAIIVQSNESVPVHEVGVIPRSTEVLVPALALPSLPVPAEREEVGSRAESLALHRPAEAEPEPVPAAILRLELRATDGAHLPPEVTVSAVPYLEGGLIFGEVKETVGTEGTSIELSLDTDQGPMKYLADEVTMGSVSVTAKGFGRQSSGLVSIGWNPGDVTELAMELHPAIGTRISCVMPGSGEPVRNVRVLVDGPSNRFHHSYRSKGGEPIELRLADDPGTEDQLYIQGDGVALMGISRSEVLALPVQGGVRRLELSRGYRLEGTVELASGLAVPTGSALAFTELRRGPDGALVEHHVAVHATGQVAIAGDGRFEIEGLGGGVVRLHLREAGRMRFNTRRLSHDIDVPVPVDPDKAVRLVIPSEQWDFTLALGWARGGPFLSSALVRAVLYRANGDEDLPYSRPLADRQAIVTSDLISANDPSHIVLPAGVIEDGAPYILAVRASQGHAVERRVFFEGMSPKLELLLEKESALELGLPALPTNPDTERRALQIEEARAAGAAITLQASSAV